MQTHVSLTIVLGAPDFKTVDCGDVKGLRRAKHYDLCLEVDYEIDKEDDILVLHKVNGEDTVFEGRLLKEKSRVSVSIEDASDPDDVEVRLRHGLPKSDYTKYADIYFC